MSERFWQPVHERYDGKGRVVYWRLVDDTGRAVGFMSKQPDGTYRAGLYQYRRGGAQNTGRAELGMFPTWQAARRAVVAAART